MTAKTGSMGSLVHSVEGVTGAACAAALKKARSLAIAAPTGRAFAAITTLSDLSQNAESHLNAGTAALALGDRSRADSEWARAAKVMDQMVSEARGGRPPRSAGPDRRRTR